MSSQFLTHIPFQLTAVARACLVILLLIVEWSFVEFGDDHTTTAMGSRPSLGHLLGVVGLLAVQPKSHRQRRAKATVSLRQWPAKNPKKGRSSFFKNVLHKDLHSLLVNKATCRENKVGDKGGKGFGCPSKKEEKCMLLFGGGHWALGSKKGRIYPILPSWSNLIFLNFGG